MLSLWAKIVNQYAGLTVLDLVRAELSVTQGRKWNWIIAYYPAHTRLVFSILTTDQSMMSFCIKDAISLDKRNLKRNCWRCCCSLWVLTFLKQLPLFFHASQQLVLHVLLCGCDSLATLLYSIPWSDELEMFSYFLKYEFWSCPKSLAETELLSPLF